MATPYQIIEKYCQDNKKNNCIRDLAYSIYMQQYEDLAKDPTLTSEAIQRILLTDNSIQSHIRSADEALADQIELEIKRVKKEIGTKSFWLSVLTGVIGNVAYSLLLVLIFYLAKDQIGAWLISLKG